MAAVDRDVKRGGPVERAAAAVPPPAGRAFRWIVVALLALSTAALAVIAALLFTLSASLQGLDVASLKAGIAGVKAETAGFHADVAKDMGTMRKGLADVANEVDSATLKLNDIALSLHKGP